MSKAEQSSGTTKEGKAERASRHLRNIHILGALALVGATVLVPPLAPATVPLAELAGLSAAGSEVARSHFAKKRRKKAK
jgi:hypothetical protein